MREPTDNDYLFHRQLDERMDNLIKELQRTINASATHIIKVLGTLIIIVGGWLCLIQYFRL